MQLECVTKVVDLSEEEFMPFIVACFILCVTTVAYAAPRKVQVGFVLDGGQGTTEQDVERFSSALNRKNDQNEFVLEFPQKLVFTADNSVDSVEDALSAALRNREVDIIVTTGMIGAKVASDMGKSRSGLSKPVVAPVVFRSYSSSR